MLLSCLLPSLTFLLSLSFRDSSILAATTINLYCFTLLNVKKTLVAADLTLVAADSTLVDANVTKVAGYPQGKG